MLFKISSKNPFRDFVRNARRIAVSEDSAYKKAENYKELWNFISNKLLENERYLNTSPAFAERCQHWNQLDIRSIKRVTNDKNPWLQFKREYAAAIASDDIYHIETAVSQSLGWFYKNEHREDWAV